MNPTRLLDFSKPDLSHALSAVKTGGYANAFAGYGLSSEEKALIYHYTYQGSDDIKKPVRASGGQLLEPLAQGLAAALAKLPVYEGIVYSAELWDTQELETLQLAAVANTPFHLDIKRWPTFLSASKLIKVAKEHLTSFGGTKNCLLKIESRTGRYIDALSHRGQHGRDPADPEEEVIFLPNTQFEILSMRVGSATSAAELVLSEYQA